jgi:FkbM family methyltransferase
MKRLMLGTPLGRWAMSIRDTIGLVKASHHNLESVGMLANDVMAGFLTVRLCRDARTFIDIGAHIGSIVSEVAHHCPSAKIIAVEAIPEKVEHLRRAFPFAEIHSCAVADSEGEATFFVNQAASGFSSLERPSDSARSDVIEITVPLRILDGLVSSTDVDVIKIDVEGEELGVLRGSERIVAENRPTIMFESGPPPDDEAHTKRELIWQWFADRNYAILVPNRLAHNDPGMSRDGFLESHLYPRRATNYFGVANERRVEIRDLARILLKINPS